MTSTTPTLWAIEWQWAAAGPLTYTYEYRASDRDGAVAALLAELADLEGLTSSDEITVRNVFLS